MRLPTKKEQNGLCDSTKNGVQNEPIFKNDFQQGKLLIRLIDRGEASSYELIAYRGGFRAAFWQLLQNVRCRLEIRFRSGR